MWANAEMAEFLEWLCVHNQHIRAEERVGFFALDVYSLWESLEAILSYLRKVDDGLAPAAWTALRCFKQLGDEPEDYATALRVVLETCEQEVVDLLLALRRHALESCFGGRNAHFDAEQNSLVLKNAEAYYRALVRGGPDAWNIGDRHMTETLERVVQQAGPSAKAIVWAHNTHVGDARFTKMAE